MLKGNGLKVLSYWNLNEDVFIFFIIAILLKVLSYWNLNKKGGNKKELIELT